MGKTLAILVTMSTYGTWMRGDRRGWVEDGVVYPEDRQLQSWDQGQMRHPPFTFDKREAFATAEAMGKELVRRGVRVYAFSLQSWHSHYVAGSTRHDIADVVKWTKDAARYHLNVGRPIWGVGYDKRYCFDWQAVASRIKYVDDHNEESGWPRRPWSFLTMPPELRERGL